MKCLKRALEFDWTCELSPMHRSLVADQMSERRYRAGEQLYAPEDAALYAYQLREGRLSAYDLDELGRKLLLKYYVPQEWAGCISLIDGEAHTLFVEADQDSVVGVLGKPALERLRNEEPAIERALSQHLAKVLRRTVAFLKSATMESVQARLVSRLVWMAGAVDPVDGIHRLDCHQESLAAMIGTTRQTVNKIIGELRSSGMLDVQYGAIVVRDLAMLRNSRTGLR